MPQSKIALCMIVKNGRDLFEECLRNISKVVDEIVVVIDEQSEDGCDEVAKSFGAKVVYRPLNGDFASQRNFSYAQVSDDIDWYLWLDSDDRVSEESAARIRTLADKGLEEGIDGFLFDYQYAFDATGRPTTVLKRERLLRKSLPWTWKYEIHEVCLIEGEKVVPNMVYDPGVVIMHRKHEMPKEFNKPRRNLDIVERVIHRYQNDVRMLFYAANEYLAYGDNKNAKKYYRKVLRQKDSWSEQRFLAALRMGYMAFDADQFDEAEKWAWEAIQIDHRWAEAFCLLGDVASERKDWRKAAHFYGFAMNTPIPKDVLMTYNPSSYTWYPAGKRAAALQNLGEYEESLKSIDAAIEFQPKDRMLRVVKNHIVQQMAEHRRDGLNGVLLVVGDGNDPSPARIRMLALAKGLELLGVDVETVSALDGKNHRDKMCVVLRGDFLPPQEIVSVIRSGRTDVVVDFCGPQELLFNQDYVQILKGATLVTTNSPRMLEQLRGVVPDRVKYIPDPAVAEREYYGFFPRNDLIRVLVVSRDEAAAGARLLPMLQGHEGVFTKFVSPSAWSQEEWTIENILDLSGWADLVLMYDDRNDEAVGGGLLATFMAAQLPVIATAVPATVNIVDHGKSGLLCYTPNEWSTYIKILVENKNGEREKMGLNARLRARRFDPRSFADRWCDFTGIQTKSVDVVIPCHGKNEMVEACLTNIEKASLPSTRAVVVANPQNPEATEHLRRIVSSFDGAILEEQDMPHSFAANCNSGIACCTGEFVSLLNNDTLVSKGWDDAMLKAIDSQGGRCIVSALSNGDFGWHYEEPLSIGSQELVARYEVDDLPEGFDLKVLESGDHMREKYGERGVQEVEWVSFAGVMMPRSVFGEVGMLDEKFENGTEDFDFCMRFKKAGGKCYYDWNSFIFHYCGNTRDEIYGTERESEKRRLMQLRNDIILAEKRKRNAMTVRFFVGPPLENWLPEDIGEKGLGGSETCVAMTARELAALGWEVHVYSTEFEVATMRQGVIYRPWSQFDPWERTDVLIVSRVPSVFDEPILNARLKILYNHDATYGDETSRAFPSIERVKNVDHLFVLSEWHKNQFMELYPHIPEEKFVVTRNGVDMRRFERQRRGRIPKDAKRFVYSHSANRGLEELLAMWPNVMRMDPDMRLHVYYGFDTWLKMAEKSGDAQSIERMKSIIRACDQPGVMLHSRVGQDQLAEEIGMANLALYPTHFHETSCCLPGTMIRTDEGLAKIEEVKTGDMVLTHDGSFQKVTEIKKRSFNGTVFGFKTKKTPWDLWVTGEHPILTYNFGRGSGSRTGKQRDFLARGGKPKREWTPAEFVDKSKRTWLLYPVPMRTGDIMTDLDLSPLLREMDRYGDDAKMEISDDKIHFPKVKSVDFPRFVRLDSAFGAIVGRYISEGSYSESGGQLSFAFNISERHRAEELMGFIKDKFDVDSTLTPGAGDWISVVVSNRVLGRLLAHMCGSGARNKHLPEFVWSAPLGFTFWMIEGIFDGDGSVNAGREIVSFTTTSDTLAFELQDLMFELADDAMGWSFDEERHSHNLTVQFGSCPGLDSMLGLEKRIKDRHQTCLQADAGILKRIQRIDTNHYSGDVYNLEVENNQSYVANGIAVHNCITAMEYALGHTQMITSPIGALNETAFSARFIDKPYMSEEYQREFFEAIRDSINQPNIADRKAAGIKTRELYDWRNVVLEWDSFFMNRLEGEPERKAEISGEGADVCVLMPYGGSGGVLYPQDLAKVWRAKGVNVSTVMVRFSTEESESIQNSFRTDVRVIDARDITQIRDEILNSKVVLAVNWQTVMLVNGLLQGEERQPKLFNLVQGDETKWVNPEAISALLSDPRWRIVYVSDYLAARFAIPGDLVPNGIDLSVFRPDASMANGVPKTATAIGFIDHASPMKNTGVLRAILPDMSEDGWMPDLSTSVAIIMASPELSGDAPALEAMSSAKNSVAAYPGPLQKTEVAHIMSMCGIWLVPSLEEGFGLVPLEAMACGAIPIVSGVGGMRMYCRDGENCLVIEDPADPEEWLDKISAVLSMNDADRNRMRIAGIQTAAAFSIEAAADKLLSLFARGETEETS
jgi:glycosyltransferase involved in cell wall biosynthesis